MLIKVLDNLIGALLGVFAISSILKYLDYLRHPGLYEVHSAPWYLSIQINAIFTGLILLLAFLLKYYLLRKKGKE